MVVAQNPFAEKVPVILADGQEHYLYFDLGSFIFIEEATGRSVIRGDAFDLYSAKDLRILLHAALMHEDETRPIEAVNKLINLKVMDNVAACLRQAIDLSMPEGEEESESVDHGDGTGKADNRGNAVNGTGQKSGRVLAPISASRKRNSGR